MKLLWLAVAATLLAGRLRRITLLGIPRFEAAAIEKLCAAR